MLRRRFFWIIILLQKGLLEPGMHFLSKPLHPEKLMQKIREALQS
jgi:hypothetical protein